MSKCKTCGEPIVDDIGCPTCYAATHKDTLYQRITREGEPQRDPREEDWEDDRR